MATALLAGIALLAVATGLGLLWRSGDGRVRRGSGERIRAADVALPPSNFGPRGTLLQFSTVYCTRCPATRRVLRDVAAGTPGVRHAEVDLTDRPDLAARYSVLQTPTTFVLDGSGTVRARLAGAPTPAGAAAALATVAGDPLGRNRFEGARG